MILCTLQGEDFNNYKPEDFCVCVCAREFDSNWVLIEIPLNQTKWTAFRKNRQPSVVTVPRVHRRDTMGKINSKVNSDKFEKKHTLRLVLFIPKGKDKIGTEHKVLC